MTDLYEWPPTRSQRAKMGARGAGDRLSEPTWSTCSKDEQNSDGLPRHPSLGRGPALRTEAYTIFESVAIVLQLIDEHPEKKLAPAVGSPERALYYQWSVFACAELDPAIMMVFDNTMRPLEHMRPPGTPHDARLAARGRRDFAIRAEILSKALSDRDYLLGRRFRARTSWSATAASWPASRD